jgi:CheY-like chemotaxis protein
MSRILLVDDSPHAQRMGERILSDEGYEVVTVSNADSALIRLDDADPDVVVADTVMPGRTGYEICQYLKMSPRHRHVRVILTAGVLEPLDEAQSQRVGADGTLKKPFEASALLAAVKPLAEAAGKDREQRTPQDPPAQTAIIKAPAPPSPFIAVVDTETVRAAVTVALDAAMDTMVEEITRRVLATLRPRKEARLEPTMVAAPPQPEPPKPSAPPPPPTPHAEPVRRVSPLRFRTGQILGLDISHPITEKKAPPPEPETKPVFAWPPNLTPGIRHAAASASPGPGPEEPAPVEPPPSDSQPTE